jgi:hypothetical protein
VEVVSLSVNAISSLEDLAACPRIRELYLRKNQISDLKQILFLTALPELRILSVGKGNNIAAGVLRLLCCLYLHSHCSIFVVCLFVVQLAL